MQAIKRKPENGMVNRGPLLIVMSWCCISDQKLIPFPESYE